MKNTKMQWKTQQRNEKYNDATKNTTKNTTTQWKYNYPMKIQQHNDNYNYPMKIQQRNENYNYSTLILMQATRLSAWVEQENWNEGWKSIRYERVYIHIYSKVGLHMA